MLLVARLQAKVSVPPATTNAASQNLRVLSICMGSSLVGDGGAVMGFTQVADGRADEWIAGDPRDRRPALVHRAWCVGIAGTVLEQTARHGGGRLREHVDDRRHGQRLRRHRERKATTGSA